MNPFHATRTLNSGPLQVLGAVVVPGALVQFALAMVLDRILGLGLLRHWLTPRTASEVIAGIISVLFAGIAWTALASLFERWFLDPSTAKRMNGSTVRYSRVEDDRSDEELCAAFEAHWDYYIARLERYRNRHLSAMVALFAWEWNGGLALLLNGVTGAFLAHVFADQFGIEQVGRLQILFVIEFLAGMLFVFRIAPWTHDAMAGIRARIVAADRESPYFDSRTW